MNFANHLSLEHEKFETSKIKKRKKKSNKKVKKESQRAVDLFAQELRMDGAPVDISAPVHAASVHVVAVQLRLKDEHADVGQRAPTDKVDEGIPAEVIANRAERHLTGA